ncbi:MAG: hypothetical protein PHN80_13445 [Hespellia sp.]|nr:hypothetical protein [Hespellia sp.]
MIAMIQCLDHGFCTFIFVPIIVLLLFSFKVLKKETRRMRCLRTLCLVLVVIFLFRMFMAQFIFTPVNYGRFAEEGYFPLIRALFYE